MLTCVASVAVMLADYRATLVRPISLGADALLLRQAIPTISALRGRMVWRISR